jgi:hypothetical protein
MTPLLTALGLFLSAFAAHLALWRIRIPRRQTRALVLVFVAVPPLAWAAARIAGVTAAPGFPPPADLTGIGLFYAGAACCYLITYAGVEEASPSLLIIRALEAAADRGSSRAELAAVVTEERFVEPRIRALTEQKITTLTPGGSCLTRRGLWLAFLAGLLARAFRIHEGG